MQKEAEEAESPKRSIRDSGYIDCWESERSDSLSPPHHGREDSFDSLDSFGSRSRQTPSPDVLVARGSSDGRGSDSESDVPPYRKLPDVRKDDMLARRTSISEPRAAMPFNQYLPNKSNQSGYVPMPLRKKRSDKEDGGRKSWSTATSPIGRDRPFRSVSMIDMRGEEEVGLQPHSQMRHELMHNQYNRMKEEDNHWQDDLARWKSRRRSVSQDLIKKEEERKMMERLMTGDGCTSTRRKSIKTYREIVEEKERREEELREAYRKARSVEEASAVLQSYAQRFSISETVLERLQLPRLLDRSISSDPAFPPSLSPSSPSHLILSLSSSLSTSDPLAMDPDGPLKYLRQQSEPVPRFTSKVEARVGKFEAFTSSPHQHQPQIQPCSSEPSTAQALSHKPVPWLIPKPYIQFQVGMAEDSLLRVNGEVQRDDVPASPESRDRQSPPNPQASPSKRFPTTAANDPNRPVSTDSPTHGVHNSPGGHTSLSVAERGAETESQDAKESAPLTQPTSLPMELQRVGADQFVIHPKEEEEKAKAAALQTPSADPQQACQGEQVELTTSNLPSTSLAQSDAVTQQGRTKTSQVSGSVQEEWSQSRDSVPVSSDPGSLGFNMSCQTALELANSARSPLATDNPKLRWEFFAPPDEAEKDHHRNEKYHCEQAKLKEEWERAQREVAEEERKYHEEERRILEETMTPLTPCSPFPLRAELSSTESPAPVVRSLADWERKQGLLERQSRGSTESMEWTRREADRTSDISSTDDSMKTGKSIPSQNSPQAETPCLALQNGQQVPFCTPKTQTTPQIQAPPPAKTPAKKQQELSLDSTKASRPAGDRRCSPIDNKTGPSKPLSPCPSPDTPPSTPNRSVSGKKLCSSCGQPLGKGAAMIIETLSLYFHIHCFKCGVCNGQLGDTSTGTDVRIRNGLLNCHQCYIRSRSAGQPTTL